MLASREPWRRTCARFGELEGLVRAQRKRKLAVVLTPNEVKRLLSFLKGVDRLFLSLLYGTGMRLTEALRLRVKDIDFATHLLLTGYDIRTVQELLGPQER